MFTETELDNDILILAAERFIIFNDDNPNAHKDFIELIANYDEMGYVELPENIGFLWEQIEHWNLGSVLDLIFNCVDSIKSFIKNGHNQHKFDCLDINKPIYLKKDITPVDEDVLRCIQRYTMFNNFADADGVDLNIRISEIEEWLRQHWNIDDDCDNFLSKVSQRFNEPKDYFCGSQSSTDNYIECLLICFMEQIRALGHDSHMEFYVEGVLFVDSEIVDDDGHIDIVLNRSADES